MLISKCKNCSTLVGAYSATSQIVRCSKCGDHIGFKGSKIQHAVLYSIMVFAMLALTNYEFQSVVSYYLTGATLFFGVYIVSFFSLSPCDSEQVKYRRKIKDFNFKAFMLSNIMHAILFAFFIPSCFYFLDSTVIVGK